MCMCMCGYQNGQISKKEKKLHIAILNLEIRPTPTKSRTEQNPSYKNLILNSTFPSAIKISLQLLEAKKKLRKKNGLRV